MPHLWRLGCSLLATVPQRSEAPSVHVIGGASAYAHDVSASWQGGSTRAWRRLREDVLRRDRGVCRAHVDGWCARRRGVHACEGKVTLQGGHAHHTLGRTVTGDDPRFIVAACPSCNLHIGDPTELQDPPNRGVTRW